MTEILGYFVMSAWALAGLSAAWMFYRFSRIKTKDILNLLEKLTDDDNEDDDWWKKE